MWKGRRCASASFAFRTGRAIQGLTGGSFLRLRCLWELGRKRDACGEFWRRADFTLPRLNLRAGSVRRLAEAAATGPGTNSIRDSWLAGESAAAPWRWRGRGGGKVPFLFLRKEDGGERQPRGRTTDAVGATCWRLIWQGKEIQGWNRNDACVENMWIFLFYFIPWSKFCFCRWKLTEF